MQQKEEAVLGVINKTGSMAVMRRKTESGVVYYIRGDQDDMVRPGPDVPENGEFEEFEDAYDRLSAHYPWYKLHFEWVDRKYRQRVADDLVHDLNLFRVEADELDNNRKSLCDALDIELYFGHAPLRSGLLDIEIELVNGAKTHYQYRLLDNEYYAYSARADDLKLISARKETSFTVIRTRGTIDVNGPTVIIRGEDGAIEYVFASDSAFLSAETVKSRDLRWWYRWKE